MDANVPDGNASSRQPGNDGTVSIQHDGANALSLAFYCELF